MNEVAVQLTCNTGFLSGREILQLQSVSRNWRSLLQSAGSLPRTVVFVKALDDIGFKRVCKLPFLFRNKIQQVILEKAFNDTTLVAMAAHLTSLTSLNLGSRVSWQITAQITDAGLEAVADLRA